MTSNNQPDAFWRGNAIEFKTVDAYRYGTQLRLYGHAFFTVKDYREYQDQLMLGILNNPDLNIPNIEWDDSDIK